MPRFLFFTKTFWNEPPRLRHQTARLLAAHGNRVDFSEHPYWPGRDRALGVCAEPDIRLFRHSELLHHKLRICGPLRAANAAWTRRSIADAAQRLGVADGDVIFNFNYEYYFLRDVFPTLPIITIINDDFITSAPKVFHPALEHAQRMTCGMSDAVLTTSVVLKEQLVAHCAPELFLPWADIEYRPPAMDSERNLLIYWGLMGRRVDYGLIDELAARLAVEEPTIEILFVGPTLPGYTDHPTLTKHRNLKHIGEAALDSLPLDRAIAGIIPYRSGIPEIDAVVLPNKVLQLLARGLPLLISGMPRFIEGPFVDRLDRGDPVEAVRKLKSRFADLQRPIREVVEQNGAAQRLAQLRQIVDAASARRAAAVRRRS
jgi:hypothetical protein